MGVDVSVEFLVHNFCFVQRQIVLIIIKMMIMIINDNDNNNNEDFSICKETALLWVSFSKDS